MKKEILTVCTVAMLCVLCGCSRTAGSSDPEYEDGNIQIAQYTGVEAGVSAPAEISDTDVEIQINRMLNDHADLVETDKPAEEGDAAVIDWENGKESVEGLDILVGENELAASVAGHRQGETYTWDDGQETYTVTVRKVAEYDVPELTDALAEELSGGASVMVAEYRKEIRVQMEKDAQSRYREELQEAVFQAVLNNTQVLEYPEDALKKAVEAAEAPYREAAESAGVEYEVFVQDYLGCTLDTLGVSETAEAMVKEQLVVEAIADREKLKADGMEFTDDWEETHENALTLLVKEWLAEHAK